MDGQPVPTAALRPPQTVMRLARMGSFHPTRLSFMRILLRRMARERWRSDRPLWEVDDQGVGRAVYRVRGPERTYSLVAFAHDLPDHLRSDRVIAEAWDATFTLFDGEPSEADLQRLASQVPGQETARMSGRELTLSRANRSVRLFNSIVEKLARGEQPEADELFRVGYLMRTTAVYGSGKFGLADREWIADRPELHPPFQAEMLTVWLIRAFTIDIVEHLATVRGGDVAVRMAPDLRRTLGVGNSTGLGMAPFLLTHPVLIHRWMAARETAFARVLACEVLPETWNAVRALTRRARRNADVWASDHPVQKAKLGDLARDLEILDQHLNRINQIGSWADLWAWAEEALSTEGQEQLLAILLEPHADLVDDLADEMAVDEGRVFPIDTAQLLTSLRAEIERDYDWALEMNWSDPASIARVWYVSEEKLEPRLGQRAEEPLEPYEQPLAPGRDVARLWAALKGFAENCSVGTFVQSHPEHRRAVRRVQQVAQHPFAEVRDNTIAAGMLPIDLLRAKLSFFGATRFDPRSDRWVRITMFQGAPFPDEPELWAEDDWMLPA